MHRRNGLSLVELLVVLVIVGVLAAMVLPVFARARVQARTATCLTNVRSVALAIRLYGSDYDAFFPRLTDRDTADWWNAYGASRGRLPDTFTWPEICGVAREADPYLRPQVILDDYLPSRQAWQCPQARLKAQPAVIVPVGRDGYWLNNFIDHTNFYDDWMAPPCQICWPAGWGGAITDSFVQGPHQYPAFDSTAFTMSIATNANLQWESPAGITNPSRYIVAADSGYEVELRDAPTLAYPEVRICGISPDRVCGDGSPGCCGTADLANCPWSATCGLTYAQQQHWYTDARLRLSKTRHLSGVNVGFLDGHVLWIRSDTLIRSLPPFPLARLDGFCSCWPGNGVV